MVPKLHGRSGSEVIIINGGVEVTLSIQKLDSSTNILFLVTMTEGLDNTGDAAALLRVIGEEYLKNSVLKRSEFTVSVDVVLDLVSKSVVISVTRRNFSLHT